MNFLDYINHLQKRYEVSQVEILEELANAGLEITKSNFSRKLKGERTLTKDEFEVILNTINPTSAEKSELRELFKIYQFGEQNYNEVCRVKDYIESFFDPITILVPDKVLNLNQITKIDSEYLISEVMFSIMSDNWNKSEIRIFCQPDNKALINSMVYLSRINSGAVKHIICLNKDGKTDSNVNNAYNINCLMCVNKLAFENTKYNVRYYYDKVNARFNSFAVFPFFIIAGNVMLMISADFQSGYLIHDESLISAYKEEFDRIYDETKPLFYVLKNDYEYIKACATLEADTHKQYYVLQNKRCLLFGVDNELILNYANKNAIDISEIIELQMKRAKNTSIMGYILYNDPDYDSFLQTGLADDWPSELCVPIPPEQRMSVLENENLDEYHTNIQIRKGFIHFPKELMIACYDNGNVLISYKKDSASPRLLMSEQSLYKSVKLFAEYVHRFETKN